MMNQKELTPASDEDALSGFSHAMCNRPLNWVATHLREINSDAASRSGKLFDYVARKPAFPFSPRTVYLAPIDESSTVIWSPGNCNELLARLSNRSRDRIPFMSVYVPMRCWYLIVFESGELKYEVYDPEDKIRTNMWTGDDMEGLGFRRFATLADFLRFTQPWFEPVDFLWTAGRWDDMAFRERLLLRADCKYRWSLRVEGLSQPVEAIGSAPAWATELAGVLPVRGK